MSRTGRALSICAASMAIVASLAFNLYFLAKPPRIVDVKRSFPVHTVLLRPACLDGHSGKEKFLDGPVTAYFRQRMTDTGFPTLIDPDGRLFITPEKEKALRDQGYAALLDRTRRIAEEAYSVAKGRKPDEGTDKTKKCSFIRAWVLKNGKRLP